MSERREWTPELLDEVVQDVKASKGDILWYVQGELNSANPQRVMEVWVPTGHPPKFVIED